MKIKSDITLSLHKKFNDKSSGHLKFKDRVVDALREVFKPSNSERKKTESIVRAIKVVEKNSPVQATDFFRTPIFRRSHVKDKTKKHTNHVIGITTGTLISLAEQAHKDKLIEVPWITNELKQKDIIGKDGKVSHEVLKEAIIQAATEAASHDMGKIAFDVNDVTSFSFDKANRNLIDKTIKVAREHGKPNVDAAVVAGLKLPELAGDRLFQESRRLYPEAFTSAYIDEATKKLISRLHSSKDIVRQVMQLYRLTDQRILEAATKHHQESHPGENLLLNALIFGDTAAASFYRTKDSKFSSERNPIRRARDFFQGSYGRNKIEPRLLEFLIRPEMLKQALTFSKAVK